MRWRERGVSPFLFPLPVTAFNYAPYPPLGVPRRQGCLGLLRWGCSSHRQRGNLRPSTSSFTPRDVRFCCIDLIVSDLPLLRPICTVERGLSSESGSVSGPPTPSKRKGAADVFNASLRRGGRFVRT